MTQTFTRTFAYASVRKLVDFSDRAKLDTPTRLLLLENDHSKFAKYIKEVNTNITELKTSVNIGFSGMDATIKKTIHTEMSTWYIKTVSYLSSMYS
jgi:wyosine [tRNA(Phe)-imidazoG37] synthetase (radical SAM superfamily)